MSENTKRAASAVELGIDPGQVAGQRATAEELITPEIAAHVLYHYGAGGYEAGEFIKRLIDLIARADPSNRARLSVAYPAYVEAVFLASQTPDGVTALTSILTGAPDGERIRPVDAGDDIALLCQAADPGREGLRRTTVTSDDDGFWLACVDCGARIWPLTVNVDLAELLRKNAEHKCGETPEDALDA